MSDSESNSEHENKKYKIDYSVTKKRRVAYQQKYREKQKLKLPGALNLVKSSCASSNIDMVDAQNDLLGDESLKNINDTSESSIYTIENQDYTSNYSLSSSESAYTDESANISSDSDNDEMLKNQNLYPNSLIDVDSFINSFSAIVFKHKLSDNAVRDILKLTNSILPQPNNCPKNIKKIHKKLFGIKDKYIKNYFYCSNCQKLSSDSKSCDTCQTQLINFITLDVSYQLKSLVDRKDIFQELIENKNKNQYNNILATTLDGSVYQKYLNQTDSDISLSLSLNSDGAPLINSKNSSLWPVLAKIVELPDSIGESFENLIFIGLWLHTEKPAYEIFMSKCVEAITEAVNCSYLKTKGYLIRYFFIFKKS
jgi:hypothetical protein